MCTHVGAEATPEERTLRVEGYRANKPTIFGACLTRHLKILAYVPLTKKAHWQGHPNSTRSKVCFLVLYQIPRQAPRSFCPSRWLRAEVRGLSSGRPGGGLGYPLWLAKIGRPGTGTWSPALSAHGLRQLRFDADPESTTESESVRPRRAIHGTPGRSEGTSG